MDALKRLAYPIARVFLALIFVVSGLAKLAASEGTAGYMESFGLPGLLVWPTIAVESVGGLMLAAGFQARLVALALAGFTLVAGLIFHNDIADQTEQIMLLKNLAIAGGLLLVWAGGPGAYSLDRKAR